MTSDNLKKLMILAASSGISSREFDQILDQVDVIGRENLISMYLELRRYVRNLDVSKVSSSKAISTRDETSRLRSDIANIIRNSGMPRSDATKKVIIYLKKTEAIDPDDEAFDYRPRESLALWLQRLIRKVGPNNALNAAIKVLGINKSPSIGAWRLSEK